jgi:transposase
VFIDHTNGRVLDVLEGRDKDLIVNYLRTNKEGLLAHLEEVTTDMWDAYANAVAEVFGSAVRVTIDRFHVVKNFQEHLTEARREIQRGLDKEAAKELKGTRWLWQTNPENLTDAQRQHLESLKERFPKLQQLVQQRESLRALFEDQTIQDAAVGASRLQAWLEQARGLGLQALERFCKTLTNWLDQIANYFVWRSSNGRTEGSTTACVRSCGVPSACSTFATFACACSTALDSPGKPNRQLWRRTLLQFPRFLVNPRPECERAHQEDVATAALDGFLRRPCDVGVAERAELRADGDANRRAGVRLALGLDVLAGEGVELREGDALALVRPLDAGLAEVVEDHGQEVA